MDRVKLKRSGQVLAPSLFTMGNMACGYYSLMASNQGDFAVAATTILGGIVFDMLDGRVARLVKGESTFGVEFDSLSDFLSFGVAPAYMIYSFTLKDYGVWGVPLSFLFALAGGLRLARFNAVAHSGAGSKSHFQGLPIPAGAGFLASFVLVYDILENRPPGALGPLLGQAMVLAPVIVVGLSLLMVSSIPYAAFKQVKPAERKNLPLLLAVLAVAALVYAYPQNAIFVIFVLYAVSGLTGLTGKPDKTASSHPEPRDPSAPGPI